LRFAVDLLLQVAIVRERRRTRFRLRQALTVKPAKKITFAEMRAAGMRGC
jgi:hypothetical protein